MAKHEQIAAAVAAGALTPNEARAPPGLSLSNHHHTPLKPY